MKRTIIGTLLLSLSCIAVAQQFDFRNSLGFVTDPQGSIAVLPTTSYPAQVNGLTFGWADTSLVQGRDRTTALDPRLAGINFAVNGYPASFYVDLPAGTYKLSLAMGDAGYAQCSLGCQVQFLDGATVLANIAVGSEQMATFYDTKCANWSAAQWPADNVGITVTLSGPRLTMLVGGSTFTKSQATTIAFLGIAPAGVPHFSLAPSFTLKQGTQASYTVNLSVANGFKSAVSMSATNLPAGIAVAFNPQTIPAPGSGSTTMTIAVGAGVSPGFYPVITLGDGGGLEQTALVPLTVTK